MYSPLAPDPLPPGPRVTSPAAPLLRLVLRVFNVVLAALALLLIGFALWMAQQYHKGGGGGGDAPPAPPLAPPEPAIVLAGRAAAAAGAAARLAGGSGQLLAAAVASFPWFIYVVGGIGAYCFATALCGLAGVKRDRRLHLGAYILLLALLVLGQAGATLLLLTDNAWGRRIPDDPSGRWRQTQDFIQRNTRDVRLAAVGTLCLELLALTAACWLHGIYQSAYEVWVDDREEHSERVREVLHRTVVQTYAGGSGSSWSARLKHKYGVEASQLEAATNTARQAAALQADYP